MFTNGQAKRRVMLLVLAVALAWAADPGLRAAAGAAAPQKKQAKQTGKVTRDQAYVDKFKRIAPSEQKAAATRAAKLGLQPGIAGLGGISTLAAQVPDPGGVPHYFGPYANWAFSPLPKGGVGTVTLVDPGTIYNSPLVTIDDAYLPPLPATGGFTAADVTAVLTGGVITGFTINNPGAG